MNSTVKKAAASAAIALSLSAAPAHAVNIFLDIKGIPGESTNDDFKGKIEVLAWGWGLSTSTNLQFGAGGGAGKASFQDVTINKYTDTSSAKLYENVVVGAPIDDAKLSVVRTTGMGEQEVITELTMQDLIVSSVSTAVGEGEDRAEETITLNFVKFCLKNNSFDAKGALIEGTPFCWDISTNKAF